DPHRNPGHETRDVAPPRLPAGATSRVSSARRNPRPTGRARAAWHLQETVRSARFTADTMALSEAVVIDGSIPTPHRTSSPTWHSTYAAAVASPPSDSACSA